MHILKSILEPLKTINFDCFVLVTIYLSTSTEQLKFSSLLHALNLDGTSQIVFSTHHDIDYKPDVNYEATGTAD